MLASRCLENIDDIDVNIDVSPPVLLKSKRKRRKLSTYLYRSIQNRNKSDKITKITPKSSAATVRTNQQTCHIDGIDSWAMASISIALYVFRTDASQRNVWDLKDVKLRLNTFYHFFRKINYLSAINKLLIISF